MIKQAQTLFRRIAGLPLLVRVIATAARAGVRRVLIVHHRIMTPQWLTERLRSPLLATVSFQFVEAPAACDRLPFVEWQPRVGDLEETWLWLPWNLITPVQTLAGLLGAEPHEPESAPTGQCRSAPVMECRRRETK